MRYAKIRSVDIVNGKGISCSLFLQGCNFHCKNCFNPETWNFNGGKEFTEDIQSQFIELCNKPFINSISILGGDPLQQPLNELVLFLKELEKLNKPIYLWSGYKFENLTKEQLEVLKYVDIFIDGQFEEDKKDYTLYLRGSSNQRIIDIQQSLQQNKIILKEE